MRSFYGESFDRRKTFEGIFWSLKLEEIRRGFSDWKIEIEREREREREREKKKNQNGAEARET